VYLSRQLAKKEMVRKIEEHAPARLIGEEVVRVNTLDGIKFYLADNSWLLIRPSGTEPVLRIYAEAPTDEAVAALLQAGGEMGKRAIE
jgi:phosphomannomutase